MVRLNKQGSINPLLVPLILVSAALIAVSFLGYKQYQSAQDYKNNVDQKVSVAVSKAVDKQKTIDVNDAAVAARSPIKTYNGPSDFGSVKIGYPRDWSLYVQTGDGSTPLDGYGQPNVVVDNKNQNIAHALRFKVLNQNYSDALNNFKSLAQSGTVKVKIYQPVNIKGVSGVIVTGQIDQNVTGTMVILPLRNTTFEIYTESNQYLGLFDKYILPNFSFKP